ncbi:MAG: FtsX-like permease family protein [Bacteroidota bacterium]
MLWFCAEDRVEEILGDLDEYYYLYAEQYPSWRAKGYYAFHVLSYLRLYNWKKRQNSNNWSMFRNYLLIAWRSIIKNPGFAAINILGLAVGIAFSALMYIYVDNELSYDSFHRKADRIQRLITIDRRIPENERKFAISPTPLGPALSAELSQIENQVRMFQWQGQVVFELDGQNYQERDWYAVDPTFFEIFDFEFLYGDPATALTDPKSVIFTEDAAMKYYGTTDIVGKTFVSGLMGSNTITGVLKDLPVNSHMQFSMLFANLKADERFAQQLNDWQSFQASTYILVSENASNEELSEAMDQFAQKYLGPMAAVMGLDYQPLREIYMLSEDIESGTSQKSGDMNYIYIFGSLGLFILLIAAINYINLATAKATFRAKEIGVRKCIGAAKGQLIAQFITEAFVVTGISFVLAWLILAFVLPYFNVMATTSFDLSMDNFVNYLVHMALIAVAIALLSGTYPAFYLSHQRVSESLKGEAISGKQSAGLRKTLVVFQFVLTIVMIVSTIVISRQLSYVTERDLGFDEERLMVIDINSFNVRKQFQTMKNEFEAIPGVSSVGVASRVPMEWKNIAEVFGQSDYSENAADSVRLFFMGFDESMVETFDFQLASGAYFGSNSANDSTKVLLNEAAVIALGLENPIGASVNIRRGGSGYDTQVIGVVKDFNFQSLHNKIGPLAIGSWNNPIQMIDYFALKVSGDIPKVIDAANEVHEKFDLNSPMEYHFLDDQMATYYDSEARAGMIFKLGAGLSIVVACLGLFGLASFTVQRRSKELGIRKVLGAGNGQLFVLLSSSFAKQVAIAFVLAVPIGYYLMEEWLSAFEYHINPGVGVFLISGFVALGIAMLTISYRAFRAVNSNPVDSLKYE